MKAKEHNFNQNFERYRRKADESIRKNTEKRKMKKVIMLTKEKIPSSTGPTPKLSESEDGDDVTVDKTGNSNYQL